MFTGDGGRILASIPFFKMLNSYTGTFVLCERLKSSPFCPLPKTDRKYSPPVPILTDVETKAVCSTCLLKMGQKISQFFNHVS